jgi:class 3 adenylate cyclase
MQICRARGVFKVETTGDAFVAVAGVPEADPDHAVRMTKFAQECLVKFNSLTRELEKQLGPETGDLKLRVGLSSGPVIGGVLLGGDSKFHIFGKCSIVTSQTYPPRLCVRHLT